MARVLTPEQFRKCPPGTLFAYGCKWAFGSLLILEEIIEGNGFWGFWANDPAWIDAEDSGEAIERLEEMLANGASYPAETSSTKYMSYDGDEMDVFLVLEKPDWDAIAGRVTFARPTPTEGDAPLSDEAEIMLTAKEFSERAMLARRFGEQLAYLKCAEIAEMKADLSEMTDEEAATLRALASRYRQMAEGGE